MDRRGVALALIGALAFVVVLVLSLRPGIGLAWLGNTEWVAYDWHLRDSQRTKPYTLAETPITIIGMEDETPGYLWDQGIIEDPVYPLPREAHRRVVERLKAAGARVVAFDILFTEKREGDLRFYDALTKLDGVISATRPSLLEESNDEDFLPITPTLQDVLTPASVEVIRTFGRSVRTVRPLVQYGKNLDQHMPHLGVALAAAQRNELGLPAQMVGGELHWGTLNLPVMGGLGTPSYLLVRYAAPEKGFPYWRYEDLLLGKVPQSALKNRIVLIGRYSQTEDRHMTPVGELPGVEILANIAQMACTGRPIRTTEAGSLWIGLAFAVGFLGVTWRFHLVPGLLVAAVLAVGWIAVAHATFVRYGIWWESATPLMVLGLALVLATPYEIFRAQRAFEQLLSRSAVRSAVSGRGMRLGTHDVFVTVVFCDIRAFTEYCETHSPDAVEAMLQTYFQAGDTAARRHGSELDKFMGDAIMLYFFELPGKEPGAVRATRWAQEMLSAAQGIGVQIGVGIASGTAREGFIGARGRMQRTVIGNVVNLAARLQEATKTTQSPVLLSEGSFSQLEGKVVAEPLGEILVRGKQIPVRVYRPTFPEEMT